MSLDPVSQLIAQQANEMVTASALGTLAAQALAAGYPYAAAAYATTAHEHTTRAQAISTQITNTLEGL